MPRLLVLADLVPPDAGPACRTALRLVARRGAEEAEVVVVDPVAAPEAVGEEAARADAVDAPAGLPVPDLPPVPDGWTVIGGPDLGTLLRAGVLVTEGAGHRVALPGLLDAAGLDGEAVGEGLRAFAARAREAGVDTPVPVRLRGASLLTPVARGRRVLGALETAPMASGLRLVEVDLAGDPDATVLAEALPALLRLWVVGHDARLRLPATARDGWVAAAAGVLDGRVVEPGVVAALRETWLALPGPRTREQVRLLRLLDDAGRASAVRAVLGQLSRPSVARGEVDAFPRAKAVIGDGEAWRAAVDRTTRNFVAPDMFLVPTWQCELRCTYCTIPKQDGRELGPATAEAAVDFLLSSHADAMSLHFFGGEPLLAWERVRGIVADVTARAADLGRRVSFGFTTNGVSLTPALLDELAGLPVWFQISMDGDAEAQRVNRPLRGTDQGGRLVPASWFLDRGIPVLCIQVVSERTAPHLVRHFFALADLGYPSIQLNYAYGRLWSDEARDTFERELYRLGLELARRWADGSCRSTLHNLGETREAIRVNDQVWVDHDGTVYESIGFLTAPALAPQVRLGHLDDLRGFDRTVLDGLDKPAVIRSSFRDKTVRNNEAVGEVLAGFLQWMHDQGWTGPEVPDPRGVRHPTDGR